MLQLLPGIFGEESPAGLVLFIESTSAKMWRQDPNPSIAHIVAIRGAAIRGAGGGGGSVVFIACSLKDRRAPRVLHIRSHIWRPQDDAWRRPQAVGGSQQGHQCPAHPQS